MNTVLVISPDYLEDVYEESKKYSFALQAYGNFKTAASKLKYINAGDLLGIAYLGETFPASGSSEFEDFVHFARLCNCMKANKKFVIVTKVATSELQKVARQNPNVRFAIVVEDVEITDLTINRSMFGSILLDNFEPYLLEDPEEEEMSQFTCESLRLRPVVPEYLFEVFEPIHTLKDSETTIKQDHILKKYPNLDSPFATLRVIAIKKKMKVDYSEDRKVFLQKAKSSDNKMYGVFLALLSKVEEETK